MSFPIQKGGFLQLCYIVDQRVHLTLSLVEMAIEGERERERYFLMQDRVTPACIYLRNDGISSIYQYPHCAHLCSVNRML